MLYVSVFGLGFVGSSIAAAWLRAGATVEGFDVSEARIRDLKNPKTLGFEEVVEEAFDTGLKNGKLLLYSTDFASKSRSKIKFVCVPIYLGKDKHADLSFLKDVSSTIGSTLKEGDAVVICPTVPPGSTRKVVVPILEKESGLIAGKDFDVIYSPERILVGRAVEDIEKRYPAVISGINDKSLLRAESIFRVVSQKGVIKMPNIETAEFEKLAEGDYRDVNIALANELAMVCDELGVDFWSVREAANSQPFSQIHVPGLGVGGACIPVYPWFVVQSVENTGTRMIEAGRAINDSMVDFLVESIKKNFHLNEKSKIAILGLAFRGGVTDSRLSVTYRLVELLRKSGLDQLRIHDPLVLNDSRVGDILTSDFYEALSFADLAIIATDHKMYKNFDWKSYKRDGKLTIIDTKGILRDKSFSSSVEVYGLGCGSKNPKLIEGPMTDS
jgi:nucleotide sugar dehydrogenase